MYSEVLFRAVREDFFLGIFIIICHVSNSLVGIFAYIV